MSEKHVLTRAYKQFLVIAAVNTVKLVLDKSVFLRFPYSRYLTEILLFDPFWLVGVPNFCVCRVRRGRLHLDFSGPGHAQLFSQVCVLLGILQVLGV